MNSVNLIGRLTKEPDTRYTDNNMCVAKFTLAVDRWTKEKKEADFISCTAFGKTAEIIEKYVHKGNRLGVSGRIHTGSYTNKEGQKIYRTEVLADRIDLLGDSSRKENAPEDAPDGFEVLDEDLPF